MTATNMTRRIRILLVDDEPYTLVQHKHAFEEHCPETLEVGIFGPNEAGSEEVGVALVEFFEGKRQTKLDVAAIDVMFLDYSMKGMNGAETFERLARLETFNLPVLIMTKNLEGVMDDTLNAVRKGLRGYVFSGHDAFFGEVEVAAERVLMETQREIWLESLMTISTRLDEARGESDLFRLAKEVFEKFSPELRVFIRQLSEDERILRLMQTSGVPEYIPNYPHNVYDRLRNLEVENLPLLRECAREGRVMVLNSLEEAKESLIKGGMSDDDLELFRKLGLEKGMMFPVMRADQTEAFGTISMYRQSQDPAFTQQDKKYARVIVQQIATSWQAQIERQRGIATAKFLDEFAQCPSEGELWKKLIQHLHERIHRGQEHLLECVTSFRRLMPGTDRLETTESVGQYRGHSEDLTGDVGVYEGKSISGLAARTNKVQRLSGQSSVPESIMCLPVSRSRHETGPICGVVNLGCKSEDFYNEFHEDYAETFCRLAGYYFERLRSREFLLKVITALGTRMEEPSLISSSIQIIKDLVGHQILVFVLRKGDRWKVAEVNGAGDKHAKKFIDELEQRLNGDGGTLLQKALSTSDPVYYNKDLSELTQGEYREPLWVAESGRKIRSQAVFKLITEGQVLGALSLEFAVTNPLSQEQQGLLLEFAGWLASLFRAREELQDIRRDHEEAERAAAIGELFAQVWHASGTHLHKLENKIVDIANADLHENLRNKLRDVKADLQKLKQFAKERKEALTGRPRITDVNPLEIWNSVCEDLEAKARKSAVNVSYEELPKTVRADPSILEMILWHLLDNALDACADRTDGEVVLSSRPGENDCVELCVRDNGIGIREGDLQRVREFGFTRKSSGLGFGLYWANRRVRVMDGYLDILLTDPGTLISIGLQK